MFGSWTFGGNKLASLKNNQGKTSEWENGFEPLSKLDVNTDGKIHGQELESLSLWFDKNQNGVSEKGEVVDLLSAGVITLYYSITERDPETGDLFSSPGFEREINGKVVTGTLVDWHSEVVDSEIELIQKKNLRALHCETERRYTNLTKYLDSKTSFLNFETTNNSEFSNLSPKVDLNGLWLWKLSEASIEKVNQSEGILTFSDPEDLNMKFSGHSIIEIPTQGKNAQFKSMVMSLPLSGKKEIDKSGKILLRFKVNGEKGSYTESIARFVSGDEMIGESMVFKSQKDKKGVLFYKWKAKKKT